MNHEEGNFAGSGGTELYYQRWRPSGKVKAAVLITHGLGEHSGRYPNVVNALVGQGFALYGFDLRGHGRSPGKRGHIASWSQHRGDVHAFATLVRQQEAGLPFFLFGHSMGGLITLEYVLHHPDSIQGVAVSAPGLTTDGLSPVMIRVSRVLSGVWPGLGVNTGLDAKAISRDPEVVKEYFDDPLVHGRATPRAGTEGFGAIAWTLAHADEWRAPLLIVHGSADSIVPVAASALFFDRVSIQDKKRIVYEGGFHESHNDLHHEQLTADLSAWLQSHL